MLDIRDFLNTNQNKTDTLTDQQKKDRMIMGSAIALNPVFSEVMRDVCLDAFVRMCECIRRREFEQAFSFLLSIDASMDIEQLFISMKDQVEEDNTPTNSSGLSVQKPDMPKV